ncbi:MAG: TIGR03620 family F420-dependent LLM class oxidoreductase [Acidimicrobiia bacterium]|nr:TIGR03620 family F420-dependent LLM class oxidoreductase [Acidimicrobiia bacterium]
MDLSPVGVWTFHLDLLPVAGAQEMVAEIEDLGYGAVWIPEAMGRDPMAHAPLLLSGGKRIVVATGIANIWNRSPVAMAAAHRTITSAFPDRFLLGLGVSHGAFVEGFLHEQYKQPLTKMKQYLDAMDAAPFMADAPSTEPTRVLAALGPKMLALAAERAAGAHPYFVSVEHTAFAREALGPDPLLCVEQAAVLSTDAEAARAAARAHMAIYLTLPNYTNNLRRFGFGDEDFDHGGSDLLVDTLVAWGDVEDVAARVRAHQDAGANHVCLQVLGTLPDDVRNPPIEQWRALAPALGLS